MEDEKNKIKEPYPPEETPHPPQIIDPSLDKERGENDRPVENRKKTESSARPKQRKEKTSKVKKKTAG